jgi:hypothetical protein
LVLGGFKLQIYLLVNKAAVDALRWLVSHFWWIVWAAALLIFVGAVTVFRGADEDQDGNCLCRYFSAPAKALGWALRYILNGGD